MLRAGNKAPSFSLQETSGKAESLAELLARGPALLVLYKSACPVCQLTFPYLERIFQGSNGSKALQVVAISQDDEWATTRFREKFKITLPTLLDREEDGYPVSNAFGIEHVPSLFLVEADGTISMATEGFVKRDMEAIGSRAGVQTFRPEEKVPEWKAG
jgi:peroxiredoxin